MEELHAETFSGLEAAMDPSIFLNCLRNGAQMNELGILSEICYGSRAPDKI
jgi:hypothetical protein